MLIFCMVNRTPNNSESIIPLFFSNFHSLPKNPTKFFMPNLFNPQIKMLSFCMANRTEHFVQPFVSMDVKSFNTLADSLFIIQLLLSFNGISLCRNVRLKPLIVIALRFLKFRFFRLLFYVFDLLFYAHSKYDKFIFFIIFAIVTPQLSPSVIRTNSQCIKFSMCFCLFVS